MDKKQPIGVFDSGLGGVSVLRELVRLLPNEEFIYFGDSVNAPYGTKTDKQITDLALKVMERLVEQNCKAVVVACNTITGVAVKTIRETYPQLIVVATEPAVKPAVQYNDSGKVLVMATPATLRSKRLLMLEERFKKRAQIINCPCPGLMEFVEKGETRSERLRQYLIQRFSEVGVDHPDSVVLGCTHYPFVRDMIQDVLGDDVKIFEGAPGIARQLKRKLAAYDLLNGSSEPGAIHWQNSSEDPELIKRGKILLNMK